MTLKEYQQRAMTTCLPDSENFSYISIAELAECTNAALEWDERNSPK